MQHIYEENVGKNAKMLIANPQKIPKYLNCVLICAFCHTAGQRG